MEILNPLQVAREDIHLKTVSLFESLKSNDTRIIQLLLQGAIQTQVNQVRKFKGSPAISEILSERDGSDIKRLQMTSFYGSKITSTTLKTLILGTVTNGKGTVIRNSIRSRNFERLG